MKILLVQMLMFITHYSNVAVDAAEKGDCGGADDWGAAGCSSSCLQQQTAAVTAAAMLDIVSSCKGSSSKSPTRATSVMKEHHTTLRGIG